MKYIIDSRYFDGSCLTSMQDDAHSDYGGETLEELIIREKNPNLIAVTPERIDFLFARYQQSLCTPFSEITEGRYWDLLECLPPKRMNFYMFFVGEPYFGNLYTFCFKVNGRFFHGERSIKMSDAELNREIDAHLKIIDFHPQIVKGVQNRAPYGSTCSNALYTPYYFINSDGKQCFIANLVTQTGDDFYDFVNPSEMAKNLLSLRSHHGEYITFHSAKHDIFDFFKWVKDNKYTIEIHGELFNSNKEVGYIDFRGNLCEYSAAFHYRIYSRDILRHVINQLRTVKRNHSWKR